MRKALGVLAGMKGLRGTAFDVFGYTEERRTERALIQEYRACVDELLAGLSPERLALAVEIARIPEDIRGYGHVKERHLQARARQMGGPACSAGASRQCAPADRPRSEFFYSCLRLMDKALAAIFA